MRTSDFIQAAARSAAGDVRQDLAVGLARAAVALPSQMATAHLVGFPPATGLIAFAAASIGFAAIGANHFLVACADSTIAPILAGGLATLAPPEAMTISRFAEASHASPPIILPAGSRR